MVANAINTPSDQCIGSDDRSAKVIVIGGSGRVGGSTVRALRRLAGPRVELLVGGRSEANFRRSVEVRFFGDLSALSYAR